MLHILLLALVTNTLASASAEESARLLRTELKEVDVDSHGHAAKVRAAETPSRASLTSPSTEVKEKEPECEYGGWGEWSACQTSCGPSTAVRVRTLVAAKHEACKEGSLETRVCNYAPCPVDCAWSQWGEWSECSVSCGKGVKSKKRSELTALQFGGQPCTGGHLRQVDCEEQNCPIDCTWSQWESWAGCPVSCGGSKEVRARSGVEGASGKPCNSSLATQKRDCGLNSCPIDCQLSAWESWTSCSLTCGVGTRSRSRKEIVVAAWGGLACEELLESKQCQEATCESECSWSQWTEWSVCSLSCGGQGEQKRSRSLNQGNTKKNCGPASASRVCGESPCPIDCLASTWTEWSACSHTCGNGIVERTRTVQAASFGGLACPGKSSFQTKSCKLSECPVDCEFSDWLDWGTCSTSCGTGKSSRTRTEQRPAERGGTECANHSLQWRDCNLLDCPVHCTMSAWSDWQTCSQSCGHGNQKRVRSIEEEPSYGGKACTDKLDGTQDCFLVQCPVDCQWSEWGEWSDCSATCGEGFSNRSRQQTPAVAAGAECVGNYTSSRECTDLPACPPECAWGEWTDWTRCSATCGNGVIKRSRKQIPQQRKGGSVCTAEGVAEQPCLIASCPAGPTDCKLEDWSSWSACSATCGNGTESRSRGVAQDMLNGGKDCVGERYESFPCVEKVCAVDCSWGLWSSWSQCTKSCGGGYTFRNRQELIPATAGGKFCEGSGREESVCEATLCPVDCTFGPWSHWSNCSTSCGGGQRKQTRSITQSAQNGGAECDGELEKADSCSEQACPVDCSWSAWTTWSMCSQSCGGGSSKRERSKARLELAGGLPCIGESYEVTTCKTQGCPRDCTWGPWSSWSSCSKSCGGGILRRYRDVAVTEKNGGSLCLGSNEQEADCNGNPCAVDCEWDVWSDWTTCPVTCDGSTRSQARTRKQWPENGGVACVGNSTREEPCNTDPCPFDCLLMDWTEWTDCTTSCGDGQKHRTRVQKLERNGGKPCEEPLSEMVTCENDPQTFGCPKTTITTTTPLNEVESVDVLGNHRDDDDEAQREKQLFGKSREEDVKQHLPFSGHIEDEQKASHTGTGIYAKYYHGHKDPELEALAAGKAAGEAAAKEAAREGKSAAEITEIARAAAQAAAKAVMGDSAAKAKPCTKDQLAATIIGTMESGNMTDVIQRLMRLKGLTGKTRPRSPEDRSGRKVAVVSGNLKLNVSQPEAFISSAEAKAAALKTMAGIAGVSENYVTVEISRVSFAAGNIKGANIDVHYEISVYENDNAGDSNSVAQHIMPSSADRVSEDLMVQLSNAGVQNKVKALSLSLKIVPVLDGYAPKAEEKKT
mmetsp:Transcript_9563/g.17110  ORF Transcript_9563/g.17110 Transcript_9563/m.17110 type:complete len:1334 (+) Transcript_9563:115-4116(+)